MMQPIHPTINGRGAADNPPNRFAPMHVEEDFEHLEGDNDSTAGPPPVPTQYFIDASQSIITTNDSPDVGFTHSLNPYRGCAHGCIYC